MHMKFLTNEDVEYLRKLDALFTSNNETVKDLIDQAVLVQKIVDPDGKAQAIIGPFQKLVFIMDDMNRQITNLSEEIRTLKYSQTQPPTWPNSSPPIWPNTSSSPYTGQPLTWPNSSPSTWWSGYSVSAADSSDDQTQLLVQE